MSDYRMTSKAKWTHRRFRRYGKDAKLMFLYLQDNCDDAGFWDLDMDALCKATGLTDEEAVNAMFELVNPKVKPARVLIRDYDSLSVDSSETKESLTKDSTETQVRLNKGLVKTKESLSGVLAEDRGILWMSRYVKHQFLRNQAALNPNYKFHKPCILSLQDHVEIMPESRVYLESILSLSKDSLKSPTERMTERVTDSRSLSRDSRESTALGTSFGSEMGDVPDGPPTTDLGKRMLPVWEELRKMDQLSTLRWEDMLRMAQTYTACNWDEAVEEIGQLVVNQLDPIRNPMAYVKTRVSLNDLKHGGKAGALEWRDKKVARDLDQDESGGSWYECQYCTFGTDDKEAYEEHMADKHPGK